MNTHYSFPKEHPNEGQVRTKEQIANIRAASLLREATIRKHVSIRGVVYPNLTRAAAAVNISTKTIRRWAASVEHPDFFFVENQHGTTNNAVSRISV